jgi:hypothetical protein
VLAVDQSQNNTDDLFEQAQSAEEAGDIGEAERLYRILMKSDPTDASAPFNLGNLLRVCARNVEAEAALRTARCGSRLITPMPYSISRCYCNEQTNIPRLQITGVAISPVIVNPNGPHGRADH